MRQVTVTVKPSGEVSVEVDGVKGSGCEALTRELETELGVVTDVCLRPEYWQKAEQPDNERA